MMWVRYGTDYPPLLYVQFKVVGPVAHLPESACAVATPLRGDVRERELVQFPDRALVRYLVDGMRHGFRVGYKRGVAPLVSARRNMLSADSNPAVVEDYLGKEVRLGRVVAITAEEAAGAGVHISRFGVIPKSSQPGKCMAAHRRLVGPGGVKRQRRHLERVVFIFVRVDRRCCEIGVEEGSGRIASKVECGERIQDHSTQLKLAAHSSAAHFTMNKLTFH